MGIFKRLKKNNDKVVDLIKESRDSSVNKYDKALKTSRDSFIKKIKVLATKHRKIDEEYFNELEELLIMSDVGIKYTSILIPKLKNEIRINKITDVNEINQLIFEFLFKNYLDDKNEISRLDLVDGELNIILVIGVNGVGKTTSIGKLTNKLTKEGKKVSLAAGDTFRAGAVSQLKVWSERTNVNITVPKKEGQDPSSVAYEAIQEAKKNNDDVLIIDTAGRLQNKTHLMNELEKLNRVITKESGKPPVEVLLVLDATSGQNGVNQALSFNEVTKLTGIILTKMDSSSKGGIILYIKDAFSIPVKFIGLGEKLDDFEEFDIEKYLYGLTKELFNE